MERKRRLDLNPEDRTLSQSQKGWRRCGKVNETRQRLGQRGQAFPQRTCRNGTTVADVEKKPLWPRDSSLALPLLDLGLGSPLYRAWVGDFLSYVPDEIDRNVNSTRFFVGENQFLQLGQ
jgi:hypothetical protein